MTTNPDTSGYAWPLSLGRCVAAMVIALAPAFATSAQPVATLTLSDALSVPACRSSLDHVNLSSDHAVATLVDLASIESPSGHELNRAKFVASRLRMAGITDVEIDELSSVTGRIPGTSGRALVFITTLDDLPAVQELQRELGPPRKIDDRVVGPATDLQSAVAAMLLAAEALAKSGTRPRDDIIFAAVSQEETGLHGMDAIYARFQERATAFVEVLGDGSQIDYGAAGAVAWWRVEATGPEGHTSQGGLPNVNQAIARAIDAIFSLPYPDLYKEKETAINVGIIRSGEVFNHKPATGWFSLDIRSDDREIVEVIADRIVSILQQVGSETGTSLVMRPDFQSLGGRIPGARDAPITQAAIAISRYLGHEPTLSEHGCCNMRVAIGGGSPAIGLRGTRGGERATRGEWASIPAMMDMARYIVLMATAAAGQQ